VQQSSLALSLCQLIFITLIFMCCEGKNEKFFLQAFHTLYHTDNNVLLGAPTGSGKTISAELAMMRLFNIQPDMKVPQLKQSFFNSLLWLLTFIFSSEFQDCAIASLLAPFCLCNFVRVNCWSWCISFLFRVWDVFCDVAGYLYCSAEGPCKGEDGRVGKRPRALA